ncbi:MAG: peptidase C45 [Planctomycetota bacterium]|nr:MAG: peptidase C45 [Planctomycetota bacterium]
MRIKYEKKLLLMRLSLAFLVSVILFSGLSRAATVMPTAPAKVTARCGRGALLDISGQRVLLVAGSPYEMGYQQGKLLKPQVQAVVKLVLVVAKTAEARQSKDYLFPGGLENAFERTRKFINKRYFDEMRGLADGADIPLKDVQLANVFPELFHCSGFALFGKATVGGKLLHGRILDYMTCVGLQKFAVVTVAKPNGYNSFVTAGYAGFLGSVTGMNDKQIAIGEMGGSCQGHWDGMPMSFLIRKVLEEAETLDEAVNIFRQAKRTCEYYYVISDGKIPDGVGLACTGEKFEVIKSSDVHPQLPYAIDDAVLMSEGKRYEHLAALVKKRYGKIDVPVALELMNRPVAMKHCLHRVLFAPMELKLWVANAADIGEENYAACYQPYYSYNFKQLLSLIPDAAPDSAEIIANKALQ